MSDSAATAASEAPALDADAHVILVDGSSYIFRAYHALPPLTRKSDGLPVGAVAGFCNMLWKLLQDADAGHRPTHMAVVFDKSEQTFRNEMFPAYKAHRPDPPEDLIPQFGLIRDATRAFSLPMIEQAGYEADDLIATYARQAEAAGATVTIVASDKDLMQLVSPTVSMLDTMKDKVIGIAEVEERFGVGPDRVIDVQALAGDSVDNIPGVPGIGVKTAAQLINTYGDLDTLLARAEEIKQPKRRQNLIEHADAARMSRDLVTLVTDVGVETPLDQLVVTERDGPRLIAFCKFMEFTALTGRVAAATGTDANAVDPVPVEIRNWQTRTVAEPERPVYRPYFNTPDRGLPLAGAPAQGQLAARVEQAKQAVAAAPFDREAYVTLMSLADLDTWLDEARSAGHFAIDLETTSLDPMRAEIAGVALALAPGRAAYVPVNHTDGGGDLLGGGRIEGQIAEADLLARLKPLAEDEATLKIGHNLKYDMLVLARHGIDLVAHDDTMLMAYALDGGRGGSGLDELSSALFGHTPIAFKEVAGTGKAQVTFERVGLDRATAYAAEDADIALRLWSILKPRLVAERMVTVYETLERGMVPVLARMEARGISIDRQILSRMSGAFAQKLEGLEAEIHDIAGERFNIGSPKQIGDILFGKFGLPGGKKTKTGAWSTGANVLEELATQGNPIAARILDWRAISKLKSTYTDLLPGFIHPETGRVHTSYALASTTTGRLSSSDPNLQNIPIRTEEGRRIRTAFVAREGMKLVSADYSQIELRVVAHVADVPELKQAFADGLDIHAMTASEMFGVPVEGMPAEVRRRAKAINFGIIYGISAFGLAGQLGISRSEAGDYIRTYFERFPGIRAYMDAMRQQVKAQGHVSTLFGRRIHFPQANSKNPAERAFVERASINAPIQGTAADIIRRAMMRMEAALEASHLGAQMLLQVHDELVFEVPEEEVEATLPLICRVMEQADEPAVKLSVPLKVDAAAADNWEAAH